MSTRQRYPLGLQILIGERKKTDPKCMYYTVLMEASGADELEARAREAAGPLLNHFDRWPLDNPEFLGVVDIHYAGSGNPRKGSVFSRFTFPCEDREDARMGIGMLQIGFPIWTLSPFYLVESFHYFPAYPRDGEPRLRVAHTILGRYDLEKGAPLATEVEKQLTTPAVTRQICMPFVPKRKDCKPELLDWRLIFLEDTPQCKGRKFVYGAPWIFRSDTELERELLTHEEIEGGFKDLVGAWNEFQRNSDE